MGGSDAEGIQGDECAELHQRCLEPDRFANASEAVKRNAACIPTRTSAPRPCAHDLVVLEPLTGRSDGADCGVGEAPGVWSGWR